MRNDMKNDDIDRLFYELQFYLGLMEAPWAADVRHPAFRKVAFDAAVLHYDELKRELARAEELRDEALAARDTWHDMALQAVHAPRHHFMGNLQCIDWSEELGFNLGNAFKYVWRAGFKGPFEQDLEKAKWYVEREKLGGQHSVSSIAQVARYASPARYDALLAVVYYASCGGAEYKKHVIEAIDNLKEELKRERNSEPVRVHEDGDGEGLAETGPGAGEASDLGPEGSK